MKLVKEDTTYHNQDNLDLDERSVGYPSTVSDDFSSFNVRSHFVSTHLEVLKSANQSNSKLCLIEEIVVLSPLSAFESVFRSVGLLHF